ncbi:hypothetical protein ACP70R_017166 [Stipagrostis hirtigluma subsp. patula]
MAAAAPVHTGFGSLTRWRKPLSLLLRGGAFRLPLEPAHRIPPPRPSHRIPPPRPSAPAPMALGPW